MNRARLKGEEQLMNAVAMWVKTKVGDSFPEGVGGIGAPVLNHGWVVSEVKRTLDELVADLSRGALDQAPVKQRKRLSAPDFTGRVSVMNNETPCSACAANDKVAILVYRQGEVVEVICRACAPELRG